MNQTNDTRSTKATIETGLADVLARALTKHGVSLRPSKCLQVVQEVVATGGPVLTQAAFEEIAQSWDGCEYSDSMIPDIGQALRRDFERLAVTPSVTESTTPVEPAPLAASDADLVVEDLAALVRKLAYALSRAKPNNTVVEGAMNFLKRKGLAGSVLRVGVPRDIAPAELGNSLDVRNLLQEAANLAHCYGQPELYTKLKGLMNVLHGARMPGYVDVIALEAASAIVPMFFEQLHSVTLKSRIQETVSDAIQAAARHYGAELRRDALDEVLHLHTIVNTAAMLLREGDRHTVAMRLEDCAASLEIVLRAPVATLKG